MTTLKAPEEVLEHFINWHRTNTVEEIPIALNDLITQDRQHIAEVLCDLLEGATTTFVPADMEWFGKEDYSEGEYKLVPAKDPAKAMNCLSCKRFLPEEGCLCGMITVEKAQALIRQTLDPISSNES